jgi:RNA polymerase sigma-70 factor (ECF subfamily)
MHEYTDEELMEMVKGDDPRLAFEELMNRYEKRLVNFLNRYAGDVSTAENLAQETFLRIYKNRMEYEPQAKFKTWLYRIATNLAIDEFRKKSRRKEDLYDEFPDKPSSNPNPHEAMIRDERARRVREKLMELDESHRVVLVMKWFEGLKYEQIAKILGISVGTVKSRVHYALKKLEVELKPLVNGDS